MLLDIVSRHKIDAKANAFGDAGYEPITQVSGCEILLERRQNLLLQVFKAQGKGGQRFLAVHRLATPKPSYVGSKLCTKVQCPIR